MRHVYYRAFKYALLVKSHLAIHNIVASNSEVISTIHEMGMINGRHYTINNDCEVALSNYTHIVIAKMEVNWLY